MRRDKLAFDSSSRQHLVPMTEQRAVLFEKRFGDPVRIVRRKSGGGFR